MTIPVPNRSSLTRYAWLSISVAALTIGLKMVAYLLTGSVGLFSDALESIVNLVGGLMALAMLTIAARPADEEHAYGHGKAEYFSSGVEGTLILVAALGIGYTAIGRLISPQPLEQLGVGLAVSVVASVANLAVSIILRRAAERYDSITLKANSQHLMTDVWTSGGVLVGVGAVALTGWQPLDSIVAMAVAANIVWSGYHIIRSSVLGLMDSSISDADLSKIRNILASYTKEGMQYHNLRTRQSGAQRIISMHVLVPGKRTVQEGHQLLERIENEILKEIPNAFVFTHLESLDDPMSWNDANK